MSSGKRYNSQKPKLNIKKVIAAIIVLAVIIMAITGIIKLFTGGNKSEEKTVPNRYFAVYTNNKWGVINSTGNYVIDPSYAEMIIIPNNKIGVFVCTYDINYETGEYKTLVLNEKNEQIFTEYDKVEAISNKDENNNIWYITEEGKLATSDGNDLYGIKPVITLNATLESKGGDGTSKTPYTLSEDPVYFASYVSLANDTYRVYDVTDNKLKLVKTNIIKNDNI